MHFFLFMNPEPKNNLFKDFQALLKEINSVFAMMKQDFPDEVRCEQGCIDCCNACYDVSFVEAAYIHGNLVTAVRDQSVMDRIISRARQAKRDVEEKIESLPPEERDREHLLAHMARWRIGCPLLTDDKTCAMYEYRPVTCRVYGLPTSIGGKGHVCGYSGFDTGKTYPSVKLDKIWKYLVALSAGVAEKLTEIDSNNGRKRFFLHDIILKWPQK